MESETPKKAGENGQISVFPDFKTLKKINFKLQSLWKNLQNVTFRIDLCWMDV